MQKDCKYVPKKMGAWTDLCSHQKGVGNSEGEEVLLIVFFFFLKLLKFYLNRTHPHLTFPGQ